MKTVAELLQERGRLVEQMRALSKASPEGFSAEDKAKYERLETAQAELKERADRMTREAELDAELNAHYGKPASKQETEEAPGRNSKAYKAALDKYLRKGQYSNALEVGTVGEGGYLTHDEFSADLRRIRDDYNALRPFVNVIRTSGDHNIRVEATSGSASWLDEEGTYTESAPSFTQVTLNAYKLTQLVLVSEELLQDSDFALDAYLADRFGKNFGIAEEAAFIAGTGTLQPTGMISGAGAVTRTESPLTAGITANTLLDVFYGLNRVYRGNATWLFNDDTVRVIRGLTDGNDNFIWQPGLQMGQPDRVLGRPYVTSQHMPVAGESPLSAVAVFGDMSVYTVADRTNITIQRLNELYAATGQVGFRAWARVDGKVTQAAGIKKVVF